MNKLMSREEEESKIIIVYGDVAIILEHVFPSFSYDALKYYKVLIGDKIEYVQKYFDKFSIVSKQQMEMEIRFRQMQEGEKVIWAV